MGNIQLAENLYRIRKAHHYTQQDISDMLNISRQAYSNYETNKRTPDFDLIIRLANFYNISIDQFANQTWKNRQFLRETKGPYTPAMEIDTADTLYLTTEEVDLLRKFRNASDEDRTLVKKILQNYQQER